MGGKCNVKERSKGNEKVSHITRSLRLFYIGWETAKIVLQFLLSVIGKDLKRYLAVYYTWSAIIQSWGIEIFRVN